MRQAARRDDNEEAIIHALQLAGWVVQKINDEDVPDLVLSKDQHSILMEIIGASKWKNNRQREGLTKGQEAWHRAHQAPVLTARTVPEALEKAARELRRLKGEK